MAERKKINWLLILQGWAMLWVVIGHAFLSPMGEGPSWEVVLMGFAYSFHMPLFILASGYLFYMTRIANPEWKGRGNLRSIIWDKTKRLLIPGLVFSIFALVLKIAFPWEMSRQVSLTTREIAHIYLFPYDNPMRELWFIAVLMWLFLLLPIWKLTLMKVWSTMITVVVLVAFHYIRPDIEFLCIGRVFYHAIWFYLGIITCKYDFVEKVLNNNAFLTLAFGIILYILGMLTDSFVTTIGGIILSFGLSLLLNNYCPKALFSFRDYTYQIFLIGIFAQMFVKILNRHISVPYVLVYIICIVMGLYVPVIVSKIIEKINWEPLLLCVGLKKKY